MIMKPLKKGQFLLKVSVLAMVAVTVSCTGMLETSNPNALTSDVVFTTDARIRQVLNGAYDAFANGNFAGGRLHVYGEIRGNDVENRTENNVTARNTYDNQFNPVSQEVLGAWQFGYLAINRANDAIQGVADNSSRLTPASATQFTAEARFLRGLTYLYLVNLYARPFHTDPNAPGVPLRLQVEKNSENNNLARSSVSAVYTQIQADLEFALNNLPHTQGSPNNNTQATRNAARLALMRMHLYKGELATAQTYADAMITGTFPTFSSPTALGPAHALAANPLVPFTSPWTDVENVFMAGVGPNDLPGVQNSLTSYYAGTAVIGDYFINTRPGSLWADSVFNATTNPGAWLGSSTDIRRRAVAQNGWTLAQTGPGAALFWIHKWRQNPAIDNVVIFRYAEVLLTAAEVRCRLNPGATLASGAGAEALQRYNAVRRRSIVGGVNRVAADFNDNTDNLLAAIMRERRIEFLGEGHRYYDLRRTSSPLPAKVYAGGAVPAVAFTDVNYIWPIPQQEINTNRLCVQNPGF